MILEDILLQFCVVWYLDTSIGHNWFWTTLEFWILIFDQLFKIWVS
jgi:hypothetical protein